MLAIWHSWARPFVGIILPMFFALSGFLVAGSLERNKSPISFFGLRIIRLAPALLVEITLSAIILGPIFTTFSIQAYFSDPLFYSYFLNVVGYIHYTLPGVFTQNPVPSIVNSQLWTIPFELKCYIMLAGIAGIGIFGRKNLLLAFMVVAQIAAAAYVIIFTPPPPPMMRGTLLVGCFLAGLTMFKFRDRLPWNGNLAVLSAIATTVLLSIPYGDYFIFVPSAYLTVYLGSCNPARNAFLLGGDYWYGMYLYGYPLQQAFTALGSWTHHWWLNMIVVYPISFAFAAFSWWCIEKPAQNLKKPLMKLESLALAFPAFHWYSQTIFVTNRSR